MLLFSTLHSPGQLRVPTALCLPPEVPARSGGRPGHSVLAEAEGSRLCTQGSPGKGSFSFSRPPRPPLAPSPLLPVTSCRTWDGPLTVRVPYEMASRLPTVLLLCRSDSTRCPDNATATTRTRTRSHSHREPGPGFQELSLDCYLSPHA